MSPRIRHILLAAAAAILTGCAQLAVHTDYNPAKPLPPLHTYQLGEVRVYDAHGRLDADNTLQKDRIARALATALAERGVSPLAQQAAQALAQAAALLILQKKFRALWEDEAK